MTPVGLCRACERGQLAPCPDAPGWTRCPWCCTTYDHWGNAYDRDWRQVTRREGG